VSEPEVPTSFDFSNHEPIAIPVVGPDKKNYILREATAEVAKKYRKATMSGTSMADGKISGIGGIADAEAILVAGCLFETYPGPNNSVNERPVLLSTVLAWPSRVVQPLFDAAQRISGLDAKDREKPDPKAGPSGEAATTSSE
jgi:hypothetical protein